MDATAYPTIDEVLALHELLLVRYGGGEGVRDPGLLDAALNRPQTGYYDSVAEEAAALMQSLAKNHPLVDGNKRVSFATTAVFLRLNGFRLSAPADEAEAFLIGEVIAGDAPLERIAAWIEAHATALGSQG